MKFSVIFLLICVSCTSLVHPSIPAIHRYTRNGGSNNGYLVYSDEVVIENYRNRTITIDSFVKIAFRYMDTVKADRPIASVTFIGKNENTNLPSPNAYDYSTVSDYYLVDIGFNNGLPHDNANWKLAMKSLGFFRNGEYDQLHSWNGRINFGKANLDSMLLSKAPFDNDFKW